MLSIIIPTLNEENYLPLLLESINPVRDSGGKKKKQNKQISNGVKKQNFSDYEIIVADAGSKDRTCEIAKEYNCKIVPGGLPAKGRNEGLKVAKGELLLFLDADVILPEEFFKKTILEFKSRKLNVGGFCFLPCQNNKFLYLLFNLFYNLPIIFLEKILPHAASVILIEKDFFQRLNGFNESIFAEDHDLARRANKIGKYGIIRSVKILYSERRFQKEGWIKTSFKFLLCELYMVFIGPVKFNLFKGRFSNYFKNKR